MENPLVDIFWLPLNITESVYLRGAVRRVMREIKASDERDYLNTILVRLEKLMYDPSKYKDLPF